MRKKYAIFNAWLVFALSVLLLTSCEDKDEYYERPSSLKSPIYQQLQEMGNFTSYLACVDKVGYTKTLSGAGYYTVFAPNDSAFKVFLTSKGLSSVADLSDELAKKIVAYSLAVSPASKDTIDDYYAKEDALVVKDAAFKRQSFYYKWVYDDTVYVDGVLTPRTIVDMNSVASEAAILGTFRVNDYNRKHIPFFTDDYMTNNKLSSDDYNYLYPNSQLTEFNVADAKVIKKNLLAENGIIHVVDKVILPLANIDEILKATPACNEFFTLMQKYLASYTLASDNYQLLYEQATGNRKSIYIKNYPYLNFALNCENFMRYGGGEAMDAYKQGWSLFAPSDEAMQAFYTDYLFKYGYKNLDEVPDFVLQEFANAHMFKKMVWPTKFATSLNEFGEPALFDPSSDVIKRELASNGLFYAVNKVQKTNAFNTLLANIILNPNYSLMYQALIDNQYVDLLKSPSNRFQMFLISNEQFANAGLNYNSASSSWEFITVATRPNLGTSASTAVKRLLDLHIVYLGLHDLYDFSNSSGILRTYGDEYIKYNKGVITASGTVTTNKASISETNSEASNGQTYSLSTPLLYSVGQLGNILRVTNRSNTYSTAQVMSYLERTANATYVDDEGVTQKNSAALYNPTTYIVNGISNTDVITVFVPNNTAMLKAVSDKLLVNGALLKAIANFCPTNNLTEILADNKIFDEFFKYHVIKGNVVVGEQAEADYTTMKQLDNGTYATLHVSGTMAIDGSVGSIKLTDHKGRTANVITTLETTYNILGNRCIVHVIDNYLSY